MMYFRFFVILVLMVILGCSRQSNKKLDDIDALCDTNPRLAMSMLDSIDYDVLSEKDRHFYDLLSIKSRDKVYVSHTSDSLILDVIDYYSYHQNDAHFPEALYYGGRVYSDIGDLPTALEYFQKAIDATPDNPKNLSFKRTLLNQTGRLLHTLRLDSAAIGYLQQSIIIDNLLQNHDNRIIATHKLLGNSYLNINDIKSARHHIDLALKYSSDFSNTHKADILIDLAGVLDREGKTDSALTVIRPLPNIVDSLALSECLSLASEIYRDAGILDTAYIYARQLTQLNSPGNKRTGYKVIFSEKLKNFVPEDTLLSLISEYKSTIEDYLNQHDGENAIIQNTQYNYNIHERERLKTEKKLYIYMLVASISVILSLILMTVILYRKFKVANTEASFATAINIMKEAGKITLDDNLIRKEYHDGISEETINDNEESPTGVEPISNGLLDSNDTIKHESPVEIKNRILSAIKTADNENRILLVNPVISASPVYLTLLKKLKTGKVITIREENIIFIKLEQLIESVSQGFLYRLQILTEGKVTPTEIRIAMLMKCGFSPIQISILVGKEKNTISTHRRNLAYKITGSKKSDSTLDFIIISL